MDDIRAYCAGIDSSWSVDGIADLDLEDDSEETSSIDVDLGQESGEEL